MPFKPDPVQTRKFMTAKRAAESHLKPGLPGILYLTDPVRSPDPVETAKRLPAGSAVIYRHFGSKDKVLVATELRRVTWRSRSLLLIGNDPELAMLAKADGVHWPEVRIMDAKYWKDRFRIMTAAAHSRITLNPNYGSSVDAFLLSTVFASESHSASKPMGSRMFRCLARQAVLPIYALGGVTANNAKSISNFGGIAGISGIEQAFGFKT